MSLPLHRKLVYSVIPLLVLAAAATAVLSLLERSGVVDVDRSDERVITGHTDLLQITAVGDRWRFDNQDARVSLTLAQDRAEGELRLLLVGGSMAMGIPYQDHGAGDLARWMQAMLEARLPGVDVTVINAAIGGMSSLGVVQTVRSCQVLQPDVLLVLSGNNEGYVPDPLDRTVHRWVVYRALRKTLLSEPEPWEHPDFQPQDARVEDIDALFHGNLEAIVAQASADDVPVVLATLPINLRWMGEVIPGAGNPYRGRGYPSMEPDEAISEGLRLCAAGDHQGAVDAFYRSEEHYTAGLALAQCLQDMGDHASALDTYRALVGTYPMGRIRPALNDIVREVAGANDSALLVDADAAYLAGDPDGMPDPTLFLDNCHFTAGGNAWLAQLLVDGMLSGGAISAEPGGPREAPPAEELARAHGWLHLFKHECPGNLVTPREPARLEPVEPGPHAAPSNADPAVFAAALARASTADWAQWRGTARDGHSPDQGLASRWPSDGPPRRWITEGIGQGYSSPAIAGRAVFVTGMVGREGMLTALDWEGAVAWQVPYGAEWHRAKPGARCTPTVRDGRVYVVSALGEVSCFEASSGERVWSVPTAQRFGSRALDFGYAESLVVDERHVYVTAGGPGAALVALHRHSGETAWTTRGVDEASGYGSPQRFELDGEPVLAAMLASSFVGVRAHDGELLWRHTYDDLHALPDRRMHTDYPNTPLVADGAVYITSGYGDGGIRFDLVDGEARHRWTDRTLDVQHGGAVLVDGYLYGANMQGETGGRWACVAWDTGEVMYDEAWNGHLGSVVSAGGMLYLYEQQTGRVGLVPATPERFEVVSSFVVREGLGDHWAHPAISGGCLFVRHGDALMVYDLRDPP
jgi:outer membrane protein assembly factor BamB